VAGIAAMVLTGILGTAMGLNNTGTFMSSCVAFVAVAMWADTQISRRRHKAARAAAGETARKTGGEEAGGAARRSGADLSLDADRPKPDGHGG
jgi:hypothetical protein